MKRVGIVVALLVIGVIVVGFASPRDISTVKPRPPKPVPVSSATAVETCAVVQFSHRGYPVGTNANEIIYDNGAVVSDSYRRVGPKPLDAIVPLKLNPGTHAVRLKVEVGGEIAHLSDEIVVNCS